MRKVHYISMAGLHGYMPNYLACHEDYGAAVEDLAALHELGRKRYRELMKRGYIELDLRNDGNEYAEITECDCDNPEDHNE